MTVDPDTNRRLLELVYDLLPVDEAAELRRRIDADLELAGAFAEAKRAAEVFREAAKIESADVELTRPDESSKPSARPQRPPTGHFSGREISARLARRASWTVGVAAAILVLVSVVGWFYHRAQLADIGAEHLRLTVSGPAVLQEGVAANYLVSTATVTGKPMSVQVELALYSADNVRLLGHKEKTDDLGRLQVTVPADLTLPDPTRLEVVAVSEDQEERIDTRLSVGSDRLATRLALDRPLYRPGQTVRYRSLTLSRFGRNAPGETSIVFTVQTPSGIVLTDSRSECVVRQGVGSGQYTLPAESPDGRYTLVTRSLDGTIPDARQTFFVRGEDRSPSESDAIDVAFYPEGGDLVAELQNRVYFTARDGDGEPLDIRGRIVDGLGREVAKVETTHSGMGAFSFLPYEGQSYRLKLDDPERTEESIGLPDVSPWGRIVINTGVRPIEPGQPLEFNLRAIEADLPLVAAASCRGVPLGQAAFITSEGANPVSVPLDDTVGGVIRLTIYDYRSSPPQPIAERLVYRRTTRRLHLEVIDRDEAREPDEEVEWTVTVTDEQQRPSPATLGVAVVEEARSGSAERSTQGRFPLLARIDNPTDLEETDFYLAKGRPAEVKLDLLLGTLGWRRIVERTTRELREDERDGWQLLEPIWDDGPVSPPAMFDNLAELQERYRASLATFRSQRTRALNTVTTLSFFGGPGLMLLVALLALLRLASSAWLWCTAIGSAVICLVLGGILMNPERLQAPPRVDVAFAPFDKDPTRLDESASETTKAGKKALSVYRYYRQPMAAEQGATSHFPETVYWNPLLTTGEDGRVQIRFKPPDSTARLRLLIDAHAAEGRLGSRERFFGEDGFEETASDGD